LTVGYGNSGYCFLATVTTPVGISTILAVVRYALETGGRLLSELTVLLR